jgi:hypothetical protein
MATLVLFMNSIPESAQRERAWHLLRWICVLPVAMLFWIAAYYASGMVAAVATAAWGSASKSTLVYWIRFGMFYIPKNAAFVFGGAMTAPRYRVATAAVLASMASGLALLVHVLGQNTVGFTNYTHFAAESAGAALGIICVVAAARGHRIGSTRRH